MAVTATVPPRSGTRAFLADVVQNRARERGIKTITEQARLFGITRQQWHRLINGDHTPSSDTLGTIADVLELPIDDFFPRARP